jgi:hypothetical protein
MDISRKKTKTGGDYNSYNSLRGHTPLRGAA